MLKYHSQNWEVYNSLDQRVYFCSRLEICTSSGGQKIRIPAKYSIRGSDQFGRYFLFELQFICSYSGIHNFEILLDIFPIFKYLF